MVDKALQAQYVKEIRYKTRLSQRKFAKEVGCSGAYIAQVENLETPLSEKIYQSIIKKFGHLADDKLNDCIEIDHIHINPSCGKGTVVLDEAEITPIKLGTQMIQSVLKISHPHNLKTFKACGDSMETIIEDGDMLLVDTGRTDFNNGGIFLLTINNDWFVKRLRLRVTGELDIISDNDKYPIESLKPDSNVEVTIKGRVIKNLSRGL